MPWSGGTFSRTNGVNTGTDVWQNDAAQSVKIRADRHDTHDQDLAAGINQCLNKDGSNTASLINVDNLRFDGNTISSTDTNGNINLTPDGTGLVNIAAVGDFAIAGTAVTASAAEINKTNDSAAAISNYVSGMRTYLRSIAASSLNISSIVTEGTFESVGPTGSSATNIWSAMDVMPAGARIAILYVQIVATAAVDSQVNMGVFARATGGSGSVNETTQIVGLNSVIDDQTGSPSIGMMVWVPLDASRRFDITWRVENEASAAAVDIYFKGFIL